MRLTFSKGKGCAFTSGYSWATHCLLYVYWPASQLAEVVCVPAGISQQDVFQNKLFLCRLHATAAELS